jgi:phosphoacetylglucosamine mutase
VISWFHKRIAFKWANLCHYAAPQLHYLVYAAYRGMPHAESDYFARLAAGFNALVASTTTKTRTETDGAEDAGGGVGGSIAVDCANGVGAAKLATLAAAVVGLYTL